MSPITTRTSPRLKAAPEDAPAKVRAEASAARERLLSRALPSRVPFPPASRRSRARPIARGAETDATRAHHAPRRSSLGYALRVAPPSRGPPRTRGDARGSPRRVFQKENTPESWLASSLTPLALVRPLPSDRPKTRPPRPPRRPPRPPRRPPGPPRRPPSPPRPRPSPPRPRSRGKKRSIRRSRPSPPPIRRPRRPPPPRRRRPRPPPPSPPPRPRRTTRRIPERRSPSRSPSRSPWPRSRPRPRRRPPPTPQES